MENFIYVNGEWLTADAAVFSYNDRGFMLGDGVYEVVRVYEGKPFALEPHVRRLFRSAGEIQLTLPVTPEDITHLVNEAVRRRGLDDAQVYIQATRGAAQRTHHFPPPSTRPSLLMYASPAPTYPDNAYTDGMAAIVLPDERWLRCDIKSIMLLANGLAKEAARQAGAIEALLEREGVGMTEGASSNLFIVQRGKLVTAPEGRYILRGITRDIVISAARDARIEVEERFFTKEELLDADEAFTTSTNIEIMPLTSIEGKTIGAGRPGPVTQRLRSLYKGAVAAGESFPAGS